MQISEFIEATSRLETYYDKEYLKEQRQIMFEELKNINIERYRKLISEAIKKCKYLPKVADFIEINNTTLYTQVAEEKDIVECEKCNNTGYLLYRKMKKNGNKDLFYTYAAICTCGNKKQYKGWEISDEEHRSNYYTPLATQLGM
ncbi:MAG: hypothetical protein IJV31_10460 [Clostridia bacterium]|nr:hypothetical protein [Clostridia bacterium]